MNRQIIFIIILIIAGGLYLQGKQIMDQDEQIIDTNDTIISSRIGHLVDSFKISEPAFYLALNGYYDLKSKDLLKNDSLIAIVDFSKSSEKKRLYVIDIKNEEIIKNTYVAHGMQSGLEIAESFSNRRLSNKSSLGLYLTQEIYQGKHGYSLRIEGMSKDLNDNAYKRAIVIHGANYVSEDFIQQNGRLGRSFGCPAVPMNEVNEIIDLIKNGACLYIYHPSLIPISQSALEKLP